MEEAVVDDLVDGAPGDVAQRHEGEVPKSEKSHKHVLLAVEDRPAVSCCRGGEYGRIG